MKNPKKKGGMAANIERFKRLCSTVGDVFTIFLIAALIMLPALFLTIGIMLVLIWIGLQEEGHASFWILGFIFAMSYLAMLAVWLFKAYGARSGFIDFCNRHQRFDAATLWTVEKESIAWKVILACLEVAWGLIEGAFKWIGASIAFLVIALIIGGILYAIAGALSAPWWAIVIIILLLNK